MAVRISEFQPNPSGTDPANMTVELSGDAGTTFSGWLISIENDSESPIGTVDRSSEISGTFDANGLLTVSIPDFENPSFTVVLLDSFTGTVGSTDIDPNDDGIPDNLSTFGTVLDAIGVPDSLVNEPFLYGTQLGGTDFAFTGTEPELIFRSASTGNWYAVNTIGDSSTVFDVNAQSVPIAGFNTDPTIGSTFGSVNPECFVTDTRILTPDGDVPVEILKIGDRVLTAAGKVVCIKWIGRQTVYPDQIVNPLRGYPILVKAGALGHQCPLRDLYVSPDHALLVEGLLINAGALVNDYSILRTTPTEPFTYYHVQLEQHSLLIAEGTAAESYLPQKEDRSCYDNGAEYAQLYPTDGILTYWPMRYPRISSKRQLPRHIARRLMQLAQLGSLQRVG